MTENVKPGKCEHCGQTVQVYKYKITPAMVYLLKDMARLTHEQVNNGSSKPRWVDTADIDRPYGVKSQITKLRLHGLVARVMVDDRQVPRTWIVTRKGWRFLGCVPIHSKVFVYNNKVIGHSDDMCRLPEVTGRADDYIAEPISEEDSQQLVDLEGEETKKKAIELGLVKE